MGRRPIGLWASRTRAKATNSGRQRWLRVDAIARVAAALNSLEALILRAELLWLRGHATAYTDRVVHRGGMTSRVESASSKEPSFPSVTSGTLVFNRWGHLLFPPVRCERPRACRSDANLPVRLQIAERSSRCRLAIGQLLGLPTHEHVGTADSAPLQRRGHPG